MARSFRGGPPDESASDRLERLIGADQRALREATRSPLATAFAELDVASRVREQQSVWKSELLRNLVDPPTARALAGALANFSSIQRVHEETARSLGSDYQKWVREASKPFGELAKVLETHRTPFASALRDPAFSTTLEQFRASAEAFTRSTALTADVTAFTLFAGEAAMRVHRAAADVEESASEAERTASAERLLGELVAVFLAISRAAPDLLSAEFKKAGLVGLLGLVLALMPLLQGPDFTPEDRSRLAEVASGIAQLTEAEIEKDREYLAQYPRALTTRSAVVRQGPERAAAMLARLGASDAVAVIERKGNWRKIAFRDRLSEALLEGWVYGDAIQLMESELPEGIKPNASGW